MKKVYLLFLMLFIISCQNEKQELNIKKLTKENKELKEEISNKKVDSLGIYLDIERRGNMKKINGFLDSLESHDKIKYEMLLQEVENRSLLLRRPYTFETNE